MIFIVQILNRIMKFIYVQSISEKSITMALIL